MSEVSSSRSNCESAHRATHPSRHHRHHHLSSGDESNHRSKSRRKDSTQPEKRMFAYYVLFAPTVPHPQLILPRNSLCLKQYPKTITFAYPANSEYGFMNTKRYFLTSSRVTKPTSIWKVCEEMELWTAGKYATISALTNLMLQIASSLLQILTLLSQKSITKEYVPLKSIRRPLQSTNGTSKGKEKVLKNWNKSEVSVPAVNLFAIYEVFTKCSR